VQVRPLCCAPAAFSGDDLIAVAAGGPHHDRLDNAAIANRAREFVELGIGKCASRIVRIGVDQLDRHATLAAPAIGCLSADVTDQRR
jgi:hypothetical protein